MEYKQHFKDIYYRYLPLFMVCVYFGLGILGTGSLIGATIFDIEFDRSTTLFVVFVCFYISHLYWVISKLHNKIMVLDDGQKE